MSKISQFCENTINYTKKNSKLLGAAALMLTMPLLSKAQSDSDYETGGRWWSLTLGTHIAPKAGKNNKTKVNFDFHAITTGFGDKDTFLGEHNWIEGGAHLTGKTIGGNGKSEGYYQTSYYSWSQKFSTAYIGLIQGQKLDISPQVALFLGVEEKGRWFPANDGTVDASFATDFGIGVMSKLMLTFPLVKGSKSRVGIELGANLQMVEFKNNNLYRQYTEFLATDKEISPPVEFYAGIVFKY